MEQLATAIVGALISGASKATTQAVIDAYAASKKILSDLIPRFDSDIEVESRSVAVEELTTRLKGLTNEEICELAEQFRVLAEKVGSDVEAAALARHIIVRRIEVGAEAELDLSGKGQVFEDISTAGYLKVKTHIDE